MFVGIVRKLLKNSCALSVFIFGAFLSLPLFALELSEDTYEVYFGDFNNDGKDGDVYFHRKDTFVLLHGDIMVPLFVPSEGSYIVYEGDGAVVTALKRSSSEISSYTRGLLGTDYEYRDMGDLDSLVDIVVELPHAGGTLVFSSMSDSYPVVSASVSTSYQYDELGRLVSVERPSGKLTAYTYDDADNRIEKVTE